MKLRLPQKPQKMRNFRRPDAKVCDTERPSGAFSLCYTVLRRNAPEPRVFLTERHLVSCVAIVTNILWKIKSDVSFP
jgi:hypothetical protein